MLADFDFYTSMPRLAYLLQVLDETCLLNRYQNGQGRTVTDPGDVFQPGPTRTLCTISMSDSMWRLYRAAASTAGSTMPSNSLPAMAVMLTKPLPAGATTNCQKGKEDGTATAWNRFSIYVHTGLLRLISVGMYGDVSTFKFR